MQKPLALSIAVCLSLTGCQVFQKSETWETVTHVRPGDSFRQADPSSSYAEKLHRVLLEQGVEHIVVTYQYHYYTHQYEEALGTRTAVVYRDNVDSHYPWWLKDERTENPVWLPNGDLDQQLSFYCRRKAEVIEKKVYSARGGSGKTSLAFRPPEAKLREHVAVHPLPVTRIAPAKPSQPQPAKPVVAYHPSVSEKPAAPSATTKPAAVTKIQRPSTVAISKPKSTGEPAPVAAGGVHLNSFWTAPAVIDPVEQASEPAPRDEHLEKVFRVRNGTSYDRTSAMDRRKMEQLKHGLVGGETSGEHGFRRGVDGGSTDQF